LVSPTLSLFWSSSPLDYHQQNTAHLPRKESRKHLKRLEEEMEGIERARRIKEQRGKEG